MCKVSGLTAWHQQSTCECNSFANQRPIAITFASDVSASAYAGPTALNPMFGVKAGFLNGAE